jgi:hypothetical protein
MKIGLRITNKKPSESAGDKFRYKKTNDRYLRQDHSKLKYPVSNFSSGSSSCESK